MRTETLFVIAVILALLCLSVVADDDAMKSCLVKHSEATCHHELQQ